MWSRIKQQTSYGVFDLSDADGRTVDTRQTFKPDPKLFWLVVKLGLLAWVIQTVAFSILAIDTPSFWIAYLTNWSVVLVLVYFVGSFLMVAGVIPISSSQNHEQQQQNANIWMKTTWFFYTVSINLSLLSTILFWILVYDPTVPLRYDHVMNHGGTLILIIIDGMVINRIPIRLRQLVWVEAVSLCYLLWNIIQQYSSIENPNRDDDDTVALYDSLDFKKNAGAAVILCVLLILLAIPALFILLMLFSSMFKTRYVRADDEDKPRVVFDEEVN